ncbi:MAG: hypothetical protein ABIR80_20390 [Opitutaceae bacterium]
MKRARFFLPAALTLLLAGSAWWASRLATRYQRQLQAQPATAARWERQIQQSREARAALLRRLEAARQKSVPSPASVEPAPTPDPAQATEVERWVRQAKRLKQAFERHPDQKIPELALLDDRDWLRKARIVQLDTEDGLQRAFAIMRNQAKSSFVQWLRDALERYVKENQGALPTDPAELRPYMNPALDAALFAQYEMVRTGKLSDAPEGPVLKLKSLIDDDYDDRVAIERREDASLTYTNGSKHDPAESADDGSPSAQIEYDLTLAVRAFVAKNRGALPASPAELIPYFDPPLGPALTEMFSRPMSPEQQKRFPEDIAKLASGRRLR